MSEQQSNKRGLRSEAQKEAAARNAYQPIPPANQAGGAFGEREGDAMSDQDLALLIEEKQIRKEE